MAQITNATATPIHIGDKNGDTYLPPFSTVTVSQITTEIQGYINNGIVVLGTDVPVPAPAPVVDKADTTSIVSLDPAFSNPISIDSLISGEDQTNNWLQTANGANQYYNILPAVQGTSGAASHKTQTLGLVGSAGDYLKSLTINVSAATDAAVYLHDGTNNLISGTTSTAPSGTTTFAATASVSQTAAINAYANYVLTVTYIPTGGSVVTIKRKVISHAAIAGSTAVSFVVDLAIPAGAAATAWSLENASAFQLLPFNQPVGVYQIQIDAKSVYGAWRVGVGSTCSVLAVGKFS